MPYLFSYGTFQDTFVQEKLFHKKIKMRPAILENHTIYVGSDGFYQTIPKENYCVKGAILDLSDNELLIADLWEEVPALYQRLPYAVQAGGQHVNAWMYNRSSMVTDRIPINQDTICSLSFDELKKELDDFLMKYHNRLLQLWS